MRCKYGFLLLPRFRAWTKKLTERQRQRDRRRERGEKHIFIPNYRYTFPGFGYLLSLCQWYLSSSPSLLLPMMDTPGTGTHQTSLGERVPEFAAKAQGLLLSASISVFSSFQPATQSWPLPFFLPWKVSAFLVSAYQPRLTYSLTWVPSCSFRVPSNACRLVPTPLLSSLAVDDFQDSRSPARHWWLMSRYFVSFVSQRFCWPNLCIQNGQLESVQYRIMSKKAQGWTACTHRMQCELCPLKENSSTAVHVNDFPSISPGLCNGGSYKLYDSEQVSSSLSASVSSSIKRS